MIPTIIHRPVLKYIVDSIVVQLLSDYLPACLNHHRPKREAKPPLTH